MSFGSFGEGAGNAPMADINTTPLVDVMLVLLVIFIITAPLFNQAVPVDLPKVDATALDDKPNVVHADLQADGTLILDGQPSDRQQFETRCRTAVAAGREAELHLRADRATRYERVAEVMAGAQRSGLTKIAFVTDPAIQ
ncbi:Biopolymer transport protein ExbD/TolR [Paramagnetospirillum magnetotacticum MS-1]|uniref:Biopolymer transport protein ExbD/TolR n=1 Tax=Paramagnetospirillum magnetotacticum MS-1 TaxID=272627 RepID=A0A0C2YXK9_PARME|nr:biopolymer transporter ExbD [Paramagnetospirillum magnetotacticum]KIL99440.1 Biopolymer transport protein ExbD/TolR [Paramagnetospirillum magnetotacticum MS-1]